MPAGNGHDPRPRCPKCRVLFGPTEPAYQVHQVLVCLDCAPRVGAADRRPPPHPVGVLNLAMALEALQREEVNRAVLSWREKPGRRRPGHGAPAEVGGVGPTP